MEDMRTLLKEIETAQREAFAAKRALELDKRGRTGSILARIVDFLAETDAEERARFAEETLSEVCDKAVATVTAYVDLESVRYLRSDGSDIEAWSSSAGKASAAAAAVERSRSLFEAASNSAEAYGNAASACRSATAMETMDAASNNKGISVMSSVSTGNAKSAVQAANDAHAEFVKLHGAYLADAVDTPDDMMDLLLDIAMPTAIDVLSIINVGRLSSIAASCAGAAERMAAVRDGIAKDLEAKTARLEESRAELLAIELPYREKAVSTVPQGLRFAIPDYAGMVREHPARKPAFRAP